MDKIYEIKTIKIITKDIIEYYNNNLNKAIEDYHILTDKKEIKENIYTEKHHILPKCMGGSDSEDNLVLLTYREHVLAHMLLSIIHSNVQGLVTAFYMMINIKIIKKCFDLEIDLDIIEQARTNHSLFMKGENNPMKNPEVKKKISELMKADIKSKEKRREALKNPEVKKKHSESILGGKNHRAKKVIDGNTNRIFDTITEISEFYGVSRSTIREWIKKKPEKNLKYLNN